MKVNTLVVLSISIVLCRPGLSESESATPPPVVAHHPGEDCLSCHAEFKLAGTVFADTEGTSPMPGVSLQMLNVDGGAVLSSNAAGNVVSSDVPDGSYLIQLGEISSKTWHAIPEQGSCNTCHEPGGHASAVRTKRMPASHTSIPSDNACVHCHYFPASMAYEQLRTPGVLDGARLALPTDESYVEIKGVRYPFDPNDYVIETVRPDVFAPGYYSLFDVILAVAKRHGIAIDCEYDEAAKTHWISAIDGVPGDYWHHWVFDIGGRNPANDLNARRDNRWDELLWRPGARVRIVEGENLAELKQAYHAEIAREIASGSAVGNVSISINPGNYQGNPEGSGRVTVTREFRNVRVTAHGLRATTATHIYSKPFQPEVVTVADVVFSLEDQKLLTAVYPVFFDRIAGSYIDSFYIQALGFPDAGVAHASGSQGFICHTHLARTNASNGRNINNAANVMHVPLDLMVIHSPDYSRWQWAQLGNPYYEKTEPQMYVQSILEDWDALERGFNLQVPYPQAFSDAVTIPYNMLELGAVDLSVQDPLGRSVATLLSEPVNDLGVHTITWQPRSEPGGTYSIVMKCNNVSQTRTVTYLKQD
jgi:hypothetical protein